jgi:hypothetical protein
MGYLDSLWSGSYGTGEEVNQQLLDANAYEGSGFSWTSLIDPIAALTGDIFGYLGTKDDLYLAQERTAQVEAMAEAEEEKRRQRTKIMIIAGMVIGFGVIVFAIVKLSKRGK